MYWALSRNLRGGYVWPGDVKPKMSSLPDSTGGRREAVWFVFGCPLFYHSVWGLIIVSLLLILEPPVLLAMLNMSYWSNRRPRQINVLFINSLHTVDTVISQAWWQTRHLEWWEFPWRASRPVGQRWVQQHQWDKNQVPGCLQWVGRPHS